MLSFYVEECDHVKYIVDEFHEKMIISELRGSERGTKHY